MKTVLVVEDEALLQMEMKLTLEASGELEVLQAFDGQSALQTVLDQHVDFACVDIRLRGVEDGLDIAQVLIDDHRIPVAFVTGNSDKSTKTKAMALGPRAYIPKPIDFAELLGLIASVLA